MEVCEFPFTIFGGELGQETFKLGQEAFNLSRQTTKDAYEIWKKQKSLDTTQTEILFEQIWQKLQQTGWLNLKEEEKPEKQKEPVKSNQKKLQFRSKMNTERLEVIRLVQEIKTQENSKPNSNIFQNIIQRQPGQEGQTKSPSNIQDYLEDQDRTSKQKRRITRKDCGEFITPYTECGQSNQFFQDTDK